LSGDAACGLTLVFVPGEHFSFSAWIPISHYRQSRVRKQMLSAAPLAVAIVGVSI
jgi:hypothetical protein